MKNLTQLLKYRISYLGASSVILIAFVLYLCSWQAAWAKTIEIQAAAAVLDPCVDATQSNYLNPLEVAKKIVRADKSSINSALVNLRQALESCVSANASGSSSSEQCIRNAQAHAGEQLANATRDYSTDYTAYYGIQLQMQAAIKVAGCDKGPTPTPSPITSDNSSFSQQGQQGAAQDPNLP